MNLDRFVTYDHQKVIRNAPSRNLYVTMGILKIMRSSSSCRLGHHEALSIQEFVVLVSGIIAVIASGGAASWRRGYSWASQIKALKMWNALEHYYRKWNLTCRRPAHQSQSGHGLPPTMPSGFIPSIMAASMITAASFDYFTVRWYGLASIWNHPRKQRLPQISRC